MLFNFINTVYITADILQSFSLTAEETQSGYWRLYLCNQTWWHLHQGLLKESSVVCFSLFFFFCQYSVDIFKHTRHHEHIVRSIVTWIQSCMKRPCGTTKKFTRQKKQQVICSALLIHLTLSHRTYDSQTVLCLFHCCRSQTSTKDGTVAAEEEQEERLLQGAGSRQECHRRWNQKSISQTSPNAPPR